MISQRHAAHLGMCAASVVVASSLGVLIAGGSDANTSAASEPQSVESTPPATKLPINAKTGQHAVNANHQLVAIAA